MTSQELESYLADSSAHAALEYWSGNCNKYPNLYQLRARHHSVPAMWAAMKRHFSAAGYVVDPQRNRLDDNPVEAVLLARCNRDLLDWYLVVVHWSGLLKNIARLLDSWIAR